MSALYDDVRSAGEGIRDMVVRGEIKEGRKKRKSVLGQVLKKAEKEGGGRDKFDDWEIGVEVEEGLGEGWRGEGGWKGEKRKRMGAGAKRQQML